MRNYKYFFEGETVITCTHCGLVHTVSFSGKHPSSIESSIEDAIEEDGWGVASMTCPDCFDPLEEQRARDQEMEDLSEMDDYETYEAYEDYSDFDTFDYEED